jgi:hypothetical protein
MISKKEAESGRLAEIKNEVEKLEKLIDKEITLNWVGTILNVPFCTSDFKQRSLDIIINEYEKAGWEVHKKYDQKDGYWLEFR